MIYIIVPVYKVEAYLNRCVNSILSQTFREFRLIIVDDGSPDNCPSMCDEYDHKQFRIHAIHQENGGLSAARNTGIDYALSQPDCEWITFIDSDDWVDCHYLERLICMAREFNLSAVKVQHKAVSSYKESESDKSNSYKAFIIPIDEYFFKYDDFVCWAILYKASLFDGVRFPHNRFHEDIYTTQRLLHNINNIGLIRESLYYYYINPSGIMKTYNDKKEIDIIEGYLQRISDFKKYHWKNATIVAVTQLKHHLLKIYSTSNNPSHRSLAKTVMRKVAIYPHWQPQESFMDQLKYWEIAYPFCAKLVCPVIRTLRHIIKK